MGDDENAIKSDFSWFCVRLRLLEQTNCHSNFRQLFFFVIARCDFQSLADSIKRKKSKMFGSALETMINVCTFWPIIFHSPTGRSRWPHECNFSVSTFQSKRSSKPNSPKHFQWVSFLSMFFFLLFAFLPFSHSN